MILCDGFCYLMSAKSTIIRYVIRVFVGRDLFFIRKKDAGPSFIPSGTENILKIQTDFSEYTLDNHINGVIISYIEKDILKAAELCGRGKSEIVRFDRYAGELYSRRRRDGDTVRVNGMTKKLKELFRAANVPVMTRDTLPLLCDGEGILWVPGVVRADRRHLTASEKPVFAVYTGGRE